MFFTPLSFIVITFIVSLTLLTSANTQHTWDNYSSCAKSCSNYYAQPVNAGDTSTTGGMTSSGSGSSGGNAAVPAVPPADIPELPLPELPIPDIAIPEDPTAFQR
jgi:hypothetical protein